MLPKLSNTLTINPLPILLSYGVGIGKNDKYFYGIKSKYVGRWRFNRIGCTNDTRYIEGMKELKIKIIQ